LNRPEPITAPRAGEAADGLSHLQRLRAFSTLAMAVLDGTIVTAALPTMARQFAVAPEIAIWIVNAFPLSEKVGEPGVGPCEPGSLFGREGGRGIVTSTVFTAHYLATRWTRMQ
jgi:hypothetical protein